jgi:hypothetical protein
MSGEENEAGITSTGCSTESAGRYHNLNHRPTIRRDLIYSDDDLPA